MKTNAEKLPSETSTSDWTEYELFREFAALQPRPQVGAERQSVASLQDDDRITKHFIITNIICDSEYLREWCVSTGLVADQTRCPSCEGPTRWKTVEGTEYWVCNLETNSVLDAVNTTGFFESLSMRRLIIMLFMWSINRKDEHLTMLESITEEEYNDFSRQMGLICIYACQKLSRRIGGRRVHVFIDITSNEVDKTMIVVGVEERNPKMFFTLFFDRNTTAKNQIKKQICEYIKPATIVFTASECDIAKEFKWHRSLNYINKVNNRLYYETWDNYLSRCKNSMFELTKTVAIFCKQFLPPTV